MAITIAVMASDDVKLRILQHLGKRAAQPQHLPNALDLPADDVAAALESLQGAGLVTKGMAAWYEDASSAIEVVSLTPAGREELARHEPPADAEAEPVEVDRETLLIELEARGFPRQQMELDPSLYGERFYFWPSIGAYSAIQISAATTEQLQRNAAVG